MFTCNNCRNIAQRDYRKRHPNRGAKASEAWRRRNRVKARVHDATHAAIACGKLIRPDYCGHCGLVGKPQAHHPDYSKPLEVIWLCAKCHTDEHKRLKALEAALRVAEKKGG